MPDTACMQDRCVYLRIAILKTEKYTARTSILEREL